MTDSLYNAGKKLKEIRLRSNLSLREFAKRIDYAPSYVSHIEKGDKRGSVDFFQKSADILNISIGDLFEDKKVPVTEELEKDGIEWILVFKELEKEGITTDKVREWLDEYKRGARDGG